VIVAALPSMYVILEDAIFDHCYFTLPAVSNDEALAIAGMIGVEKSIVL
jgi:hypothetical protein